MHTHFVVCMAVGIADNNVVMDVVAVNVRSDHIFVVTVSGDGLSELFAYTMGFFWCNSVVRVKTLDYMPRQDGSWAQAIAGCFIVVHHTVRQVSGIVRIPSCERGANESPMIGFIIPENVSNAFIKGCFYLPYFHDSHSYFLSPVGCFCCRIIISLWYWMS